MIGKKTNINVSNASTDSEHPSHLLAWIVPGLVAMFTAGIIGTAAINSVKLEAVAEQKAAEDRDAENIAFCQKLGVSPSTQASESCKLELANLRRREQDKERSATNLP